MTSKRIGVLALISTIALGACTGGKSATFPSPHQVQPAASPEARAVPIAEGFVTALGAAHTDEAIGYLADGADLTDLAGVIAPERLPLLVSWFEATGYQQRNITCAAATINDLGTDVRCTFDYQAIRSAGLGRGPYGGSYYDLTIQDDRIQSATLAWETKKFSRQVWEPFADWIDKTYPDDGAVMYAPGYGDFKLSKASIRLWEEHTREYVKLAGG